MTQIITISLDNVLDIALKGVRRAAVFMGLGVNAAIDPDFKSYQLSQLTNIQMVPDDVSPEELTHFKEEFRLWIEAGGFRELADTFATYLDAVHHACLLMKTVTGQPSLADVPKIHAKYRRWGLPDKLSVLSERFDVAPQKPAHLLSLSRARNCLTHRGGIVGDDDLQGAEALSLHWVGVDVFIDEPNGTRHLVNEILSRTPINLPNGGTPKVQFSERTRRFKRREKLILSTRELAEICWIYAHEARFLLGRVGEFAKAVGVEIKPTENQTAEGSGQVP